MASCPGNAKGARGQSHGPLVCVRCVSGARWLLYVCWSGRNTQTFNSVDAAAAAAAAAEVATQARCSSRSNPARIAFMIAEARLAAPSLS